MTKDYIFNIHKPYDGMNGRFVYLRLSQLEQCIKRKYRVFVKIPSGVGEIDPTAWIKTGTRMSKVFLNPKVPMILYGNYVSIHTPKVEIEVEEVIKNKTLF